jgi:hypothetical protein
MHDELFSLKPGFLLDFGCGFNSGRVSRTDSAGISRESRACDLVPRRFLIVMQPENPRHHCRIGMRLLS